MGNEKSGFKLSEFNSWYFENVKDFTWWGAHRIEKELHHSKTKFQDMKIYQLSHLGKTLILDGMVQSAENDECIYHELLVHPALLFHPNPKKVFIGGGGEGATAREVLRHKSIERCIMVDIDGDCVGECRKLLPSFNKGVYEDERMELRIDDAIEYINCYEKNDFDVLIMDLADPQEGGPCYTLYTKEYYETCKKRLKDNGILVTQSTSCDRYCCDEAFTAIHNTLKQVFPKVLPYSIHVPSFGGTWGFNIAFKNEEMEIEDVDELIQERIIGGEKSLQIYDGETHIRSFNLTKDVRKKIKEEKRIIQKGNYVFYT